MYLDQIWWSVRGSLKVVALFSATNVSSYVIELIRLHDTIQIKWNYEWIHLKQPYDVTYRYQNMCKISFLLPNLVAFSCYAVNTLQKWLMSCVAKRAIRWDLHNKHISIWCIKHMSTIFRTLQVSKWKTKHFFSFCEITATKLGTKN